VNRAARLEGEHTMKRMNAFIATAAATLGIALGAHAGVQYEITSFTMHGGGKIDGGGSPYVLEGTFGQPDGTPVALTGGPWSLCGGYWHTGCSDDPCPSDFDDDGVVGIEDLLSLLGAWGACAPPCPQDFDANGFVTVDDLLAFLSGWGSCAGS
jgi:hypothetical protein